MDWFPLFQNISGKEFAIAGGGKIALRRVKTLLQFDCRIKVFAREFCREILEEKKIELIEKTFAGPEDAAVFAEADYAVAATNNREANRLIGEFCRNRGIPVSVADRKEESSFYFPAVVIKDGTVIGISSEGKSPRRTGALAEFLRQMNWRH